MPDCTTFYAADRNVGEDIVIVGAGACTAISYAFSKALQCITMGIQVDKKGSRAMCRTFAFYKYGMIIAAAQKVPAREEIVQARTE